MTQPSGRPARPPGPQLQVLRPRVRVHRGAVAEGLPGGILLDESGRYRKSVGAIAERNDGQDGRCLGDRGSAGEERYT